MAKVRVYYNRLGPDNKQDVRMENADDMAVPYVWHGGDVCFILKNEKIPESGSRTRGIWSYSDDQQQIYFTCPWCSGANVVPEEVLEFRARPHEQFWCLWCVKCERHLWVSFSR